MVIDGHCHFTGGDGIVAPLGAAANLRRYLKRAARAGIARTVLMPLFDSDYFAANRRLARIMAAHPGRFHGFAFVHPVRDRGRIARLVAEAVEDLGFSGIKVHSKEGPITTEICEAARRFGVPVLCDVAGDVALARGMAAGYPDVDFIVPHLGSFDEDVKAQRAMIGLLERYPNLHADTSGVRYFDLLAYAVRRAGAEKFLFGSDGPFLHPGVELAKIRALGLPEKEEALILGGNFLRLMERSIERREAMNRSSPGGCTGGSLTRVW